MRTINTYFPSPFQTCNILLTIVIREGAQGASPVAPGKSGPHEMARGSSSLLSSHGRVIGPQDGLKKDSRGLSRVTA